MGIKIVTPSGTFTPPAPKPFPPRPRPNPTIPKELL